MSISRAYISIFSIAVLLSITFFGVVAHAQSEKGAMMSAEHRGAVANVAQDIRETAGKDNNIGEELREIAKEQEEASERSVEAIEAIETRGKFRTFLFGTDYKSVGVLRSELVTTDNHIDRLTKAKDRTDNPAVQADLDAEIAELEETKTNVETFIQENEGKLSLLGWLIKLFN